MVMMSRMHPGAFREALANEVIWSTISAVLGVSFASARMRAMAWSADVGRSLVKLAKSVQSRRGRQDKVYFAYTPGR
jgi:hypothetical protein